MRAAQQRRQEQAVGLQGAADLHQRAGQIVDRLQGKQADGQIERASAAARISCASKSAHDPVLRERLQISGGTASPIHKPVLEAARHRRQPVGQAFQRRG